MNEDLSIINLVVEATFAVQIVLAILALFSIASWTVIIEKQRLLKQAGGAADDFEASFWSGLNLTALFRDVSEKDEVPGGMAGIFEAGYREFGRLQQQAGITADQLIEGARRSMRVSQMREMDRLEQNLSMLATIGSTSPYIGLFGTVWGIMNAFQSLGSVQSVTIAVVAPHIAEALIATAMGLFAAIPAVMFYNRYADQVSRLEVRYDTFMEELSSIFQRSAARGLMKASAEEGAA